MKKTSHFLSIILLCGLVLTACTSAPQPSEPQTMSTEPPAQESASTEAPEAAASEPAATEPATGSSVQHTDVPGTPPTTGGEKFSDHSSISSLNQARAFLGDNWADGKYERPYNANTMDIYFPHLDIDHAVIHADDPTWVYAVISMVGRDPNNGFSGQYAVELDLDQHGQGDFLILVDQPASADWTTQGVSVYADSNVDIGGVKAVGEDSAGAASDGYEAVLFDQGSGDDADLAWVRLDPSDPNSIQIAFKQALLAGEKTYTAGLWAGTHIDPSLFDYSDHFTHEQIGDPNKDVTAFYPIKGLSEFDNTCRQAVGFDASGIEPGICGAQ